MSAVGLYLHGDREDARALGQTITTWLSDRAHVVEVEPEHPSDFDLVVAVGGDGTVLRGARGAVVADADVIGINLGELGYLAEVEPAGWEAAFQAYFDGRHQIEERMLVEASVRGRQNPPPGLNEVVIEKQALGRTVRLRVSIDGAFFTSYVADGVIVATPTGSTAYSLSARGPIVAPSHRALVLTPVSPHTLFDRSLVLGPESVVTVEVVGDRDAAMSIDGHDHGIIGVGEQVTISAAADPARFVTFGPRNFHKILKSKFGLNDR